jgi:TET-Associated Glycosyltransferase
MAVEIKLVIPTHGRAGRVTTHHLVDNCSLCVAESQVPEYRRYYPKIDIIVHPDSVIGLTAKRQWMYENLGSIFMLDDDLYSFSRRYTRRLSPLSPREAYDIIQWAGNIAHLMGAYLFGFSNTPKPMYYDATRPFQLTGFINTCAIGMLEGSGLWYDPKVVCEHDWWICGLNAHFHRKVFIDDRFCWLQTDTMTNRGGQSKFRSLEVEQSDVMYLRKHFGSAVVLRKIIGTGKHQRRPKHAFSPRITLPF